MSLSPDPAAGVSPDTFRALLGRFPSGVTVVTVLDAAGRAHGMTVSAFCSVSIRPPLILVSIDRAATMRPLLEVGRAFGVNVLGDQQADTSQRFADEAMELRFDGLDWTKGPGEVPWIGGAHSNLACTVVQRVAAGDHDLVIGQVIDGRYDEATRPLVYHRGAYHGLR